MIQLDSIAATVQKVVDSTTPAKKKGNEFDKSEFSDQKVHNSGL